MSKPSKLKIAIKEMEIELEGLKEERDSIEARINDRISTVEMLKKIDEDKNGKG